MRLSCALLTLTNDILLKFWVKNRKFLVKSSLSSEIFLKFAPKVINNLKTINAYEKTATYYHGVCGYHQC